MGWFLSFDERNRFPVVSVRIGPGRSRLTTDVALVLVQM